MQRSDFEQIFREMAGLPVTIRLLDPPLHEFLPHSEKEYAELAKATGVTLEFMKKRANELHEFNPMLGTPWLSFIKTHTLRFVKCKLVPIFEASINVKKETGQSVLCEVMVPH